MSDGISRRTDEILKELQAAAHRRGVAEGLERAAVDCDNEAEFRKQHGDNPMAITLAHMAARFRFLAAEQREGKA